MVWKVDIHSIGSIAVLWYEQFDTREEAIEFRREFNERKPLIANEPYEEKE